MNQLTAWLKQVAQEIDDALSAAGIPGQVTAGHVTGDTNAPDSATFGYTVAIPIDIQLNPWAKPAGELENPLAPTGADGPEISPATLPQPSTPPFRRRNFQP